MIFSQVQKTQWQLPLNSWDLAGLYLWVYWLKTKECVVLKWYADAAWIRTKHTLILLKCNNAGEKLRNKLTEVTEFFWSPWVETLFAAACSLLVAAEWAGRSVRAAWQVTGSPGHLYGLEPSASAAVAVQLHLLTPNLHVVFKSNQQK